MWFLVLFCFSCSTIYFFGKRNQSSKKSSKPMSVKVQSNNKNWLQNIQVKHNRLNVVLMCYIVRNETQSCQSACVQWRLFLFRGKLDVLQKVNYNSLTENWVEQYFETYFYKMKWSLLKELCNNCYNSILKFCKYYYSYTYKNHQCSKIFDYQVTT